MSELHDEIRSALAEMVDEAPPPPPFRHVTTTGRPPMRWSGPAVAVAVFATVLVVIGAVALLRPTGDATSPVADLPSLHEDVDGPALTGAGLPSYMPSGLEPTVADVSFAPLNQGMNLVYRRSGTDGTSTDLRIQTTRPISAGLAGAEPPDVDTMERRLRESLTGLTVTPTTVRGLPAFLVQDGDADTQGWETAVLTVEGPDLLSQVLGVGIPADEVLRVSRSLEPVDRAAFDDWAVGAIRWDVRVRDRVADPAAFVENLRRLEAVADVTTFTIRDLRESPALAVQRNDSATAFPTTTMTVPVDPDASTTTTLVAPRPVDVLVTIDDGVDPLDAAWAIRPLAARPSITFSPRAERQVTAEFLDTVLAGATVIHDDPTIYQPAPGPEPHFDTSELGTEIPLAPADTGTDISPQELPMMTTIGGMSPSDQEPADGPILHLGVLDDGTRLVLLFDGGADYHTRTIQDDGYSGGVDSLGTYRYGEIGSGGSSDGPTYVQIRTPLDTSIVQLELPDGDRYWQRPIAGHALMAIDIGADQWRPDFLITAYNADGQTIGQWSTDR